MRRQPIVTLGPAVVVAALLMIGSALGGAGATPASWDAVTPALGGPTADHGAMAEPRELAVDPEAGRVPRDLHGALEGVLLPGTPVMGTPDNSTSAGGRSRLPHPSWPPPPLPPAGAPAGGRSLAPPDGSWRPARVAGANRSIPRPPPAQQ